MEPQEFSNLLTELILSTETRLRRSIRAYQRRLTRFIADLISSTEGTFALDTRTNGSIKATTKNIQTLARIKREIDRWLKANELPGLQDFTSGLDDIAALNQEFLNREFSNRTLVVSGGERVIEAAKTTAVDTIVASTQNESLADPIKKILDSSTSGGGASRSQLVQELTDHIQGSDGRLGGLERFASRYVRDSLNQTARSYQEILTGNIDRGNRWYFYTSGTVEDTREFCLQRNGRYWHESEIRAWASLRWQGKAAGTNERNIFTLLGGYNCMHQLILVSASRVPASALRRIS